MATGQPLVLKCEIGAIHTSVVGPTVGRRDAVGTLRDDWEYAAGPVTGGFPRQQDWLPAGNATTLAAVRRNVDHAGGMEWFDGDGSDHWFGTDVVLSDDIVRERGLVLLELDGVATIAEFYWNDRLVGRSESMFREHSIDISDVVRPGINRLAVRCLSLTHWLAGKKPARARWKTRLVEEQKLRGVRTTLLGRATGWSPPTTVVGLWRDARVVEVRDLRAEPRIRARLVGRHGVVSGTVGLCGVPGREPVAVESFIARRTDGTVAATLSSEWSIAGNVTINAGRALVGRWEVSGSATVENPDLWWPHTHGGQARYETTLMVRTADGTLEEIVLGTVGFREIAVDRGADDNGFGLVVNGLAVFVRGGAWFPVDPSTFAVDDVALRERLVLVAQGGHNMVRVSGTAAYESASFYALCDELGLLVWQDLPFANFDYPGDPAFLADVADEVTAFLNRVSHAPSLCVVSGNSEVEQQASMMGIASSDLSGGELAALLVELFSPDDRGLIFVASTPTRGHLPFAVDVGVSHYFGVGAYRRPLTDARHAGVRFAAECLGLSNVPVPSTVRLVGADGPSTPSNPRWKERVPRDRGTGWDFEDIRDFYARELFDLDLSEVRYADPDRYLAVARAVSCAIIERTLAEWRRPGSSCRGALLWTLNDLWPGAGWGLIDSVGRPKSAYWGARRSLSPVAVTGVDEGLNGLDLHLYNDGPSAVRGELEVRAIRGASTLHNATVPAVVDAHGSMRFRVDEVFGRFTDPTYAYKFGPRVIDAVSAVWTDDRGRVVGRHVYVPKGERHSADPALMIEGDVRWVSPTVFELDLRSNRLAQFVTVDLGSAVALASDDHCNLVPGSGPHTIRYELLAGPLPKRAFVSALNGAAETVVVIPAPRST